MLALLTLYSCVWYLPANAQTMPVDPFAAATDVDALYAQQSDVVYIKRSAPVESPTMKISDTSTRINAVIFIIRMKRKENAAESAPPKPWPGALPEAASADASAQTKKLQAGTAPAVQAAPLTEAEIAEAARAFAVAEEIRIFNEKYANSRTEQIKLLAKTIWGEARGIDSEMEKAAVAWCVLNRVSNDHFPDTIIENVAADSQFNGYSSSNPVLGHLYSIAEDVYSRWEREQNGITHVGRVLPADYCYFVGNGSRNDFSQRVDSPEKWNWSLRNPYPAIRAQRIRAYEPDHEELEMIAQAIYRSARNIKSKREQAAVAWCIFNRVASGLYPDTVREVLEQPGQFPDNLEKTPVKEEYLALAKDVWTRWDAEQNGEENVGRVLPADYLYIRGNGKRNTFIKKTSNKDYRWTWKLPDPYIAEATPAGENGSANKTDTVTQTGRNPSISLS